MPYSPIRAAYIAVPLVLALAGSALAQSPQIADPVQFRLNAQRQVAVLAEEKATRSAGMRKLDQALIFTVRTARGEDLRRFLPKLRLPKIVNTDGTVDVEVSADVTSLLLVQLRGLGGSIGGVYPKFKSLSARIPVRSLEAAALLPGVKRIKRPGEYVTNAGSVQSEGDVSMRTAELFNVYGLTGSGVKVGTISDSERHRENSQGTGDLPAVQILSGRNGRRADNSDTGEGTAMMELIHDVAPGSGLAFSTSGNSEAEMAQNYLDLFAAGCKVVNDDIIFLAEPAFQDGPIAAAVDQIVQAGGLVFSSAGNQGNTRDGTSGVWEGDFTDSGVPFNYGGSTGNRPLNAWLNGQQAYNLQEAGSLSLQWNDPWGNASTDYDLFVFDGFGNLVDYGAENNVGGNPLEMPVNRLQGGEYAAVAKFSGANRVLRLCNFGGKMNYVTGGQTFGHMASALCIGVGAIPAATSPQRPFNSGDEPEDFSADGFRRIYYDKNGNLIASNLTYAGALVRNKPTLSAPDKTMTTVPNFQPFSGTSAAAPHAAALAALLWQFAPDLTPAQLTNALTQGCVDILTAGYDRFSGAGAVSGVNSVKLLLQGKTLGVSPATSSFAGTAGTTLTLDLGRNAPPAGILVNIAKTGDTARFNVPSQISVAPGSRTATINVGAAGTGTGTLNLTLTEAYTGAALGTATVNRTADTGPNVASVTLDPASVVGASRNVAGKVTLSGNATSTYTVQLQSTNTAVATVPATVSVSSGQNFKTFVVTSKAVATDTNVTIRARKQGTTAWTEATLLVKAPKPNSCVPNPTSGMPGTSVTYTIKLDGPAPTGGITFGLVTTDANVIAVPRTLTIPAGATQTTFNATAGPSPVKKTVTVSVRYQSVTVAQGRFAILVPEVSALTISPGTVKGGANSTGRVTLASAAPTGGITVTLSKSGTGATIPATVTVAAGQTSKTFAITTVATTTTRTFKIVAKTATVQKSAILTITP